MNDKTPVLTREVEVGEAYIDGRHARKFKFSKKAPVFSAVERGGYVRTMYAKSTSVKFLLPELYKKVRVSISIYSYEYRPYTKLARYGYPHSSANHSKYQWADEMTQQTD